MRHARKKAAEQQSRRFFAAILVLVFLCLASVPAWSQASGERQNHALIFVIDGIPNGPFEEMLAAGELPNFRAHIYERGVHSANHITVFPPLTFPAMASLFSGCYPSTHRVPTFFWVNREHAAYKNYLSTIIGEYQADVQKNVHLMFDYFPDSRTLCLGLPVNIGADWHRDIEVSFLDPFRECRDLDYVSKAVERRHTIGPDMLVRPDKLLSLFNPAREANIISLINPFSHSSAFQYVVGSFSETERELRRQVPHAVLYYEWAPDHFGHEDGADSLDVRQSLIAADTQFGRLVKVYQRAGLYEDTFFMLLSDHGQIKAIPKYVPMDRIWAERGFKVEVVSHELIAKAGLGGLLHVGSILVGSGSIVGRNCVVGSAGGGAVSIFLTKGGGVSAESWKHEVYYRDLLDYPLGEKDRINIVDFIHSIENVDFFFVRENERLPGEPHLTRIISRSGSSLINARFDDTSPAELAYEVIEGEDPLGYTSDPAVAPLVSSGYHDEREWLRATAQSAYPDAPVQISQIMELERSGSIIVIPSGPHTFNSRVWAKHGSLCTDEMRTVFAVSGPGLGKGVLPYSRTIDVLPTFLHLMGKESGDAHIDGVVLDMPSRSGLCVTSAAH